MLNAQLVDRKLFSIILRVSGSHKAKTTTNKMTTITTGGGIGLAAQLVKEAEQMPRALAVLAGCKPDKKLRDAM